MKIVSQLVVLVFSICFMSCNDADQMKLIKGKWKAVEWSVNGNPNANPVAGVNFQFNEDETYEYNNSSLHEEGTYKVQGGHLFTTPKGELEISVEITKLTVDTLEFNMSRSGTPETMILVKEN